MNIFPGYRVLHQLHRGRSFELYRVESEVSEGEQWIAKLPLEGDDQGWKASRLKHEHNVLRKLSNRGVLGVKAVVEHEGRAMLLMHDFEGWTLARLLRERREQLGLEDLLKIALQLTQALGEIHACNVVHNDLNPDSVLVDPSTLETKIIGFAIASLLSRERPSIAAPEKIESALAYISPEQTGRMNRLVDYRSDYYSLGAMLYEIFTGQLPFATASKDPMMLVHSHIAKVPPAPSTLRPTLPPRISKLILKLLAKMADERYQSTFTIEGELRARLAELRGEEVEATDRADVAAQLQVSQKLYGRDDEVRQLLEAFERVGGHEGGVEMVLVAGYSGIGKSSLVSEIHKPIAREGGCFAEGKFDQFNRNIPYVSLILALRQLVRQLLTKSQDDLAIWRERLVEAISPNGQIIAEVIPEVELIVGEQSPVPSLGPTESRNRFNHTFRQFISAFASPDQPLVLFLDDLQWADTASLNLLQSLISDRQLRNMLLIGAYRDNEVDATHPLTQMLDAAREVEAKLETITLHTLDEVHVGQLLADTLYCDAAEAAPLVALLMRKTRGNPFFLIRVLHDIYESNLLSFDGQAGRWRWSIEDIEGIGITSNVVDFVLAKLRAFAPATQRVLTVAACVGNRFDLELLALVTGASCSEVAELLWPALVGELVVPLDHDYKAAQVSGELGGRSVRYVFLHDRVQQAAYELVDGQERERIHLQIGRLLLEHRNEEEIEESIFDITMHLNAGITTTDEPELLRKAMILNHRAGQRARDSSAHTTGLECMRAAMALLPEGHWEQDYEISLDLYRDRVELEYLNINFDDAEHFTEEVLTHAKNVLDTIPVYETRIQFYVSQNKMRAAIDVVLEVLAKLEITLVDAPPADLPSDEELLALPAMSDLDILAGMRILTAAMPACYIADPALLPSISFTMVKLSIEHGNSQYSAYACSFFGLIQCGVLGDIDMGYRFGKLALRMLENYDAVELESKVYALFYIFVIHWKEHVRESISGLLHGVRVGLDTGDIEYAGYNAIHYCTFPLFMGADLEWVGGEMAKYEELSLELDQQYQLYYIRMWRQLLLGLREEGCDGQYLAGSCFDERTMLDNLGENRTSKFTLHQAKGMLLYAFGYHGEALASLREADEFKDAASGFVSPVQHNLYMSLSLLSVYGGLSSDEQVEALALVDANQEQMAAWAAHAPTNNSHKHDLVAAERARAMGDPLAALALYERAIAGSREQGYLNEQALAYERMGEALLALGHGELASHQLGAALEHYEEWGAHAKCADLRARHPQLGDKSTAQNRPTDANSQALDMITVVKASQALASEIVLERLLGKMMRIVVENSGAQAGVLLLIEDGEPLVVAEGSATTEIQVHDAAPSPAEASDRVPMSIVNFVTRTRESVVINDASEDRIFSDDPYFERKRPKSILCAPLINKESLIGVFYVEHSLAAGVFTPARLEVLGLLSTQVAISIENSQLYAWLEEYNRTLEAKVATRTEELQEKNLRLSQSLQRINLMQEQIIAQEKLASLGSVTAGVAHEIRNPLNFVNNFALTAQDMLGELKEELTLSRTNIEADAFSSMDELCVDLAGSLRRIHEHGNRIDTIVRDMLNLATGGASVPEQVRFNELVSEYVDLAHKSACAASSRRYPPITTTYAEGLPELSLLRHDLGRVVLNMLSNAYAAVDEKQEGEGVAFVPQVQVRTTDMGSHVELGIRDNGPGISSEVLKKIFDPFFTTKPAGAGTGLGLSISHEIVRKHGGSIRIETELGQFSEFVIRLPKERSPAIADTAPS